MPTLSPSFDNLASPSVARQPASHLAQNIAVAAVVVLLHAAALWALQRGLTERAVPPALPAPRVITAELLAPPAPAPAEPPAAAPAPVLPPQPVVEKPKPEPVRQPPPKPRAAAKTPAPKPLPMRPEKMTPPAPVAPEPASAAAPTPVTASAAPNPQATAPVAVASNPSATAPAEPAPARTVPPSSSAAYLDNPPPVYPAMSRRLGESGTVVLRVLIGTNGRAEQAQIDQSSGYERLDQAALETARDRWRYVPGTRNGVPEAMWFKVPIKFVLE